MDLNFAEFLEEYVPIMPESVQDGVLKRTQECLSTAIPPESP